MAREDAYVTKETQKFLCLFDPAISMITGQPNGDHAKGFETMPKAWRSYQGHGAPAKGMETMPKACKPC